MTEPVPVALAMTRWRKRPVVIEAVQWTGSNLSEVEAFCDPGYFGAVAPEDRAEDPERTAEVYDRLHGTWVGVYDGQWVIRGVQGELYPIAPDVLAATYEPAESPQSPAAVPVAEDSGRDSATAPEQAQQRTGASGPSPVAAAFDREAVREIVWAALAPGWSDDDYLAGLITGALWPLLEHAQEALSGNEGVRLWMLDCGELVAKHRARADAAEAKLVEVSAFWLCTDEDGGIILNAPCADTLGCLWSSCPGGDRVTLGQLIAAAGTHTGMTAGELHASLAAATGMADEGPPNGGSPVIHSGAVAPGGWVCAVPVPDRPDQICGMPVESEPCTEHGEAGRDPS